MAVLELQLVAYPRIRIWSIYLAFIRHYWHNATSSPVAHVEYDYVYRGTRTIEIWRDLG